LSVETDLAVKTTAQAATQIFAGADVDGVHAVAQVSNASLGTISASVHDTNRDRARDGGSRLSKSSAAGCQCSQSIYIFIKTAE
jgi:hypothetical protein